MGSKTIITSVIWGAFNVASALFPDLKEAFGQLHEAINAGLAALMVIFLRFGIAKSERPK